MTLFSGGGRIPSERKKKGNGLWLLEGSHGHEKKGPQIVRHFLARSLGNGGEKRAQKGPGPTIFPERSPQKRVGKGGVVFCSGGVTGQTAPSRKGGGKGSPIFNPPRKEGGGAEKALGVGSTEGGFPVRQRGGNQKKKN